MAKKDKATEKEATPRISREEKPTEHGARLTPSKHEDVKIEDVEGGDYLQQYQYGREMEIGHPNTNPSPTSKAFKMKEQLLKQPKVSIFIPRAEGEDPKIKLSVNLNGYRLDLPKQKYLVLPRQIAEVIMESQKQQVEALLPYQISRDKTTGEALA